MILIISTSLAFILAGIYYSYGFYLGYVSNVDMCNNYDCDFVPVFPTSTVLFGIALFIVGILIFVFRKRFVVVEFLNYKKKLKSFLSVLLVVIASWIDFVVTKPCSNNRSFMCDYSVGFPVRFWIVTDYIDNTLIARFFVGVLFNFVIWFLLLSVIFNVIIKKKSSIVR